MPVQSVITCVVTATPSATDLVLCPPAGGQSFAAQVAQVYTLDPSQAAMINAAIGPFDYAYATTAFFIGFVSVTTMFLVGHGAALVLAAIKDW
jgi:hypothetical protein